MIPAGRQSLRGRPEQPAQSGAQELGGHEAAAGGAEEEEVMTPLREYGGKDLLLLCVREGDGGQSLVFLSERKRLSSDDSAAS